MKTLTIKQPWASLIIEGYKRFEFRSWQTKYRGELLIHAGKGVDREAMKRLRKYLPNEIPSGKIIGKVTLADCIECNDEFKTMCLKENAEVYQKSQFEEKFAWELKNVEKFANPIEAKGKLSLWEYDLK